MKIPVLRSLAPSASIGAFSADKGLRAINSGAFLEGANAEGLMPSADPSQSKPVSGDDETGGEL